MSSGHKGGGGGRNGVDRLDVRLSRRFLWLRYIVVYCHIGEDGEM